jgi:flagellin-like protein
MAARERERLSPWFGLIILVAMALIATGFNGGV